MDEAALARARDRVWAALDADDPITTLRSTALDLAGAGLPERTVVAIFAGVCEALGAAGRDEEAGYVAEVLDMMAEWYAGGRPCD